MKTTETMSNEKKREKLYEALKQATEPGDCTYQTCVVGKLAEIHGIDTTNWRSQSITDIDTPLNDLYGETKLNKIQEEWDMGCDEATGRDVDGTKTDVRELIDTLYPVTE